MAVATYADVAVSRGRPIEASAQQAQVEWWLSGLELLIASRLGAVAELDQDALKYVEAEAIALKLDNFLRRQQESSVTVKVDDGSVTRRYESPVTAADVADDLWALLSPANAATAYTVAVSSPLDVA